MTAASPLPDLFAYMYTEQGTAEYVSFAPDASLNLRKELQFVINKATTVRNLDLFNHWAPNLIASGYPLFQQAVIQNPLASARHIQALLAGYRPQYEIMLHAARHPNTTPPIIDKILSLTDPVNTQMIDLALAQRPDLIERHIMMLIRRSAPGILAALAANEHIPEAFRVHAALSPQ